MTVSTEDQARGKVMLPELQVGKIRKLWGCMDGGDS